MRLIGMTMTDERPIADARDASTPAPSDHHPARAWLAATAGIGLVVVVLAFLVGGSSTGGSGGKSADTAASSGSLRNAAPSMPAPVEGASNQLASGAAASGAAASADKSAPNTPAVAGAPSVPVDSVNKVVKTGEMDLAVNKGKVPATMNQLIGLATLERGYIADSHSSQGPSPTGSVTLRVPVQSFESTLGQVRQLRNVKVVSQQTAGEDVTNKYVDLQARVRSLVATRSTFERLLARATTIGDTLAVQSRITDVQTQIEQLQGELRVLNDQTTFGTLTVTLDENATKVIARPHHQSGMSKAFHRSLDRFVHGIEAIVGVIGPLLLVALLAGIAWAAGRPVYRRVRRQLV
jgi:hypothetical protein